VALDNEDINGLLRHVHERERGAGMAALDDAIVADLREADDSPPQLLSNVTRIARSSRLCPIGIRREGPRA
jgi:hypothetical protein